MERKVALYLVAGVRCAPHFMEGLQTVLRYKLEERGFLVKSQLLFPYDDWSRRLIPQLREIRYDLGLRYARYARSIGGRRILEAIQDGISQNVANRVEAQSAIQMITADNHTESNLSNRDNGSEQEEGETTLFIGHSAGGVAALHAAGVKLASQGGKPCPVLMIGSPRCRIPLPLRTSTFYLYAADRRVRVRRHADFIYSSDPICRIGTFGGWGSGTARRAGFGWQRDKHAPSYSCAIPIVGGHADYFRQGAPFVNEAGESNMDLTLKAAWPWLLEQLVSGPNE